MIQIIFSNSISVSETLRNFYVQDNCISVKLKGSSKSHRTFVAELEIEYRFLRYEESFSLGTSQLLFKYGYIFLYHYFICNIQKSKEISSHQYRSVSVFRFSVWVSVTSSIGTGLLYSAISFFSNLINYFYFQKQLLKKCNLVIKWYSVPWEGIWTSIYGLIEA